MAPEAVEFGALDIAAFLLLCGMLLMALFPHGWRL